MPGVRSFDDAAAAARAAAEAVVAAARARGEAGLPFRLGLSGGRTPVLLYRALAAPPLRGSIAWRSVHVFFADERAVPPDDPESNLRLARETLIAPAGIPAGNVHRMKGDARDLESAAREYEALLAEPLDVLILGVGEDGHTASLFPGSPLVGEAARRVAPVLDAPKPPPRRITVTPRAIHEARRVIVLASGEAKAAAVAAALEGRVGPGEVPARLMRDRDWYLDRAAASRLGRAG
jgi:6-phosphogluconolactonase